MTYNILKEKVEVRGKKRRYSKTLLSIFNEEIRLFIQKSTVILC